MSHDIRLVQVSFGDVAGNFRGQQDKVYESQRTNNGRGIYVRELRPYNVVIDGVAIY